MKHFYFKKMENSQQFQQNVEQLIKYFLIGLVIYASYLIYKPFLLISIWAIILSVSFESFYLGLNKLLKGKKKLSAIIFSLLLLITLVLPTTLILDSISGYIENIINNFISGWILMWERPIKIGDFLEVENAKGRVEAINTRSTRIRRVDGVHMLIPNSKLLENTVVN